MKKVLCLVLTVILLLCAVVPAMAESPVKVFAGGQKIIFDVQPQIINDRTMVPLRKIFEALGATVLWDDATRTVTSTKDGITIKLTIDSPTMYVNNDVVTLDSPACIIDGRTLVPARAVSEAFKLKVEWLGETRTVRIKKPTSLEIESSYAKEYEYNDMGQRTYIGYIGNVWNKFTYDEDWNRVRTDGPDGFWSKSTYDERGNQLSIERNDNTWTKMQYDANNNVTYMENSKGVWQKFTYDENGNTISKEMSDGSWIKTTYDDAGNGIYHEYSNGYSIKVTYDANGNPTYYEGADGSWEKFTYDASGNPTYWEDSNGSWEKYTYDANGNLIQKEASDGSWTKYTYDANGNLIYEEDSKGVWKKYEVREV